MRLFHRFGFGIQSPWAYDLVTNVLFAHSHYYAFESLKRQHPHHARRGEQLFRLVNALHPTTAAIIADDTEAETAEAFRAYIQAASTGLQVTTLTATPAKPCDLLLILTPKHFCLEDWQSSNCLADSTVIVIEHIGSSSKSLWQQILQHPSVTATFDIGSHRGIAFFDPKRTKMNYKV